MNKKTKEKAEVPFRLWLQNEFTQRCRRNSRYSLRAFSKLISTDPSSVSQILSGKRVASSKVIRKICERLSASPEVIQAFEENIRSKKLGPTQDYLQISADTFAVIADWYHYAILELTSVPGFKNSPRWVAKKLGITSVEASLAIERLLRLELLKVVDSSLVKTESHFTNGRDGSTAPALKELQRQLLEKALLSVDNEPIESKDITSMTMAIDPKKIPKARELIRKFRRELCTFLEEGSSSRVYNLGVQLFQVSDPVE